MRVPYAKLNLSIGKYEVTQEELSILRMSLCPLCFLSPADCSCATEGLEVGVRAALASVHYTDPLSAPLESLQSCLSLLLLF